MTAKELHDLYAPLWAKVPETRPFHKDFPIVFHEDEDDGDRFRVQTEPRHWHSLSDKIAAALCRVAVEDWLRNDVVTSHTVYGEPNHDLMPKYSSEEDGTSIFLDWPCKWATQGIDVEDGAAMFTGPTIHHALVAAALAVAGKENA